jgi:hypothetical protein
MYIITLGDARPTDLQKQTSLSYVQIKIKIFRIISFFKKEKREDIKHIPQAG